MYDQLALALSCKRLLHISALVKLKYNNRPPKPTKQLTRVATWYFGVILVRREPYCEPRNHPARFFAEFLWRIHPLTETGNWHHGWVPCSNCLRYRPGDLSYWEGKVQRYTWSKSQPGYNKRCANHIVKNWGTGPNLDCLECVFLKGRRCHRARDTQSKELLCMECEWCEVRQRDGCVETI